jgi:hypothetical protein
LVRERGGTFSKQPGLGLQPLSVHHHVSHCLRLHRASKPIAIVHRKP